MMHLETPPIKSCCYLLSNKTKGHMPITAHTLNALITNINKIF
jgi:hypothetical protein